MDKKQGKFSSKRPSYKTKKRAFRGNRYSAEKNTDYTSTSAKKLKNTEDLDVNVNPSFNYCISQFTAVFFQLQQLLKCCNADSYFRLPSATSLRTGHPKKPLSAR